MAIELIIGGARSGKSRYAEELALSRPPPRLYLATAESRDGEMAERIREHRQRAVIGGPARVREQLLELQERYAADEIVVVTITGDYASRLRSYELLAGAFALAAPLSRDACDG